MGEKENSTLEYQEHEINDLLIIGESNTSVSFSQSLQQLDYFTRIFHVIQAKDAVKLLVQQDFSVIIIDNDAEKVDAIHLSKIIRDNLPISRIVIISSNYSSKLIKNLINYGSIDAFIPVPIDPFSGSSIIIEQYAKFQINQTLFNLVTHAPPRFSQSYYLLHDPIPKEEYPARIQFVGFVIIHSSVTRYSNFFSDQLNIDEYLLTGYISAISLLGQQLFEENSFFREINFGGLSVVMNQENELQYLFFFKDLNKTSFQQIEKEIDRIISQVNSRFKNELMNQKQISEETEDIITELIERFFDKQKNNVDPDNKQTLILFGNQLPKLNKILAENSQKYNVWRYFNHQDVLDHLMESPVDILVINQILKDDTWNFDLASQAKDIHPSLQIVALLEKMDQSNLLKILNNDYLDFVLFYKDDPEVIKDNLDQAFLKAFKIKTYLTNYHPHNMQYSLHRSAIARSMLRNYTSSYQISKIPEFFGMFIMYGEVPYFTKLWPMNNLGEMSFDEQLFASFISSMEMFTDEIFDTKQEFSGFRFGDITILIKHEIEFTFVYFLSNIDHTNFLMVDRQLEHYSKIFYDTIVNSDGFFDLDLEKQFDVTELIQQHLTELFIHLVSLNFTI